MSDQNIQNFISKSIQQDQIPVTVGYIIEKQGCQDNIAKLNLQEYYGNNFDKVIAYFKVISLENDQSTLTEQIMDEQRLEFFSQQETSIVGISLLGLVNIAVDNSQILQVLYNNETVRSNNIEQLGQELRSLNLQQKVRDAQNTDNLRKRNFEQAQEMSKNKSANSQQQQATQQSQQQQQQQQQPKIINKPNNNQNASSQQQQQQQNASKPKANPITNMFSQNQNKPQQQQQLSFQTQNQQPQQPATKEAKLMMKRGRRIDSDDDDDDNQNNDNLQEQLQQSNSSDNNQNVNKNNNIISSDDECQFEANLGSKKTKLTAPSLPQKKENKMDIEQQPKQNQQKSTQNAKPAQNNTNAKKNTKAQPKQQPGIMSFFAKK